MSASFGEVGASPLFPFTTLKKTFPHNQSFEKVTVFAEGLAQLKIPWYFYLCDNISHTDFECSFENWPRELNIQFPISIRHKVWTHTSKKTIRREEH